MKVLLKGRVSDIFDGEKSKYVTFNDVEAGGQIKLGLPLTTGVKLDGLYDLDLEVKPQFGKDGLFLKVIKLSKKGE